MTTEEFIQRYRNENVRQLAFVATKYPEIDAAYALDQIRGWQIAKTKLPHWAKMSGVQYPPHLSMEQCSSQPTAIYKADVAKRLLATDDANSHNALFVDITGGLGVDFSFIASALDIPSVYVERNEHLCSLARINFPLLGLCKARVECGDGEEYATSLQHASLVYIDPARRNSHGARTYGIEDCTPNILTLLPHLMLHADFVMVKLSPMLDWHSAVEAINGCLAGCRVSEVHIVSVSNECKELLLVVAHGTPRLQVVCANGDAIFAHSPATISPAIPYAMPADITACWLFEPNASIMKAGCFAALASVYPVRGVGKSSHLFVAETDIVEFPGRRFKVMTMSTMNKKELRNTLAGVSKANITTRNFPMAVAELRKKLKLKDGGDMYIFATTLVDGSHVLIVCKKVK